MSSEYTIKKSNISFLITSCPQHTGETRLDVEKKTTTLLYLENDQEGKEDQHKEQQAAGVQREQVILVWEIRLRKKRQVDVRQSIQPF